MRHDVYLEFLKGSWVVENGGHTLGKNGIQFMLAEQWRAEVQEVPV